MYKTTKEFSDYQIYLEAFNRKCSSPRRRADPGFSSQDGTITFEKRSKVESHMCVDTPTDHKYVDGLDLSTPFTYSSPHQYSQFLVGVYTGERILQAEITSLVLRKPSTVK